MIFIDDWKLQQMAINVCHRRGVNPNEIVPAPAIPGHDIYQTVPRWTLVAQEVKDYIALRSVVDPELGHLL